MQRRFLIIAFMALSACSIRQTVEPVASSERASVSVIKNPDVRDSFLQAYTDALQRKGLQPRVVAKGDNLTSCDFASTYRANWSWDLALYMSYAEIKVYKGHQVIGKVEYDSTHGGGRLDKFINAERKIGELVDELFLSPGGKAGGEAQVGWIPLERYAAR